MNISILHWLGFEFVDLRCEAGPDGTATAQADDVFAQCRSGLGRFGLSLEDTVRSRIWASTGHPAMLPAPHASPPCPAPPAAPVRATSRRDIS
jgi:hypothetical protein